ncbi:hypothetical protein V8G54_007106 [Vigna mungo]|uniref:Uncharacterized protein n=1 Tax=Vigna mungo TaxID=3915 RepID=A0AAQ3P127_VIGMU
MLLPLSGFELSLSLFCKKGAKWVSFERFFKTSRGFTFLSSHFAIPRCPCVVSCKLHLQFAMRFCMSVLGVSSVADFFLFPVVVSSLSSLVMATVYIVLFLAILSGVSIEHTVLWILGRLLGF